jgi:2-(1,2-epoxy-1,2-dihydrophenyl)acetyl-CoA isomerase
MTSSGEKVLVTLDQGIKRITFNRPEVRNAVDTQTVQLLRSAIQECASDGSRVVVLTGAGESFCAGAELGALSGKEFAEYNITRFLREDVNQVIMAMRSLPAPIIARVHGPAVGVGCNYALASDLIIASDQASFGQVFVRIGLMPDGGGTYFLPRLVGYHKAFELMATGNIIDAAEAFKLGMINQVVPFAELDAAVAAAADRLAQAPRVAIEKIKTGLNHAMAFDLPAALEFEAVNQDACFHSPDFVEGVSAFLQKRKPAFGAKG